MSAAPVDHTVQATIDGEWVVTRTVATTDDAANPAHAVGTVSTRNVLFGDVNCTDGPCTGGVLSGPTHDGARLARRSRRRRTPCSYEYTGFLNCLRQDTGAVLVANGFVHASSSSWRPMPPTIEGNHPRGHMTYTDTLTTRRSRPDAARAGTPRHSPRLDHPVDPEAPDDAHSACMLAGDRSRRRPRRTGATAQGSAPSRRTGRRFGSPSAGESTGSQCRSPGAGVRGPGARGATSTTQDRLELLLRHRIAVVAQLEEITRSLAAIDFKIATLQGKQVTDMKQITLGTNGPEIGRIGLGLMGMSAFYTGAAQDDDGSIGTIHRASSSGVTFLDTAEIYGPYLNEELLGKAIAGRAGRGGDRDEVRHAPAPRRRQPRPRRQRRRTCGSRSRAR